MRKLLAVCTLSALAACASQPAAMTDASKKALGDSVKAIATGMVDAMNKGDMSSGFNMYSASASARYTENGMTYPNVDAMKKMSADMGGSMESFHIALDAVDDVVLGPDAVLITSPFHMTAKVKGKPEWKGQGVWSGVFQRNGGKWEVISTHESVQHPDQMMAAMTPVPTKKTAAKPAATAAKKPAAKSTTKKK